MKLKVLLPDNNIKVVSPPPSVSRSARTQFARTTRRVKRFWAADKKITTWTRFTHTPEYQWNPILLPVVQQQQQPLFIRHMWRSSNSAVDKARTHVYCQQDFYNEPNALANHPCSRQISSYIIFRPCRPPYFVYVSTAFSRVKTDEKRKKISVFAVVATWPARDVVVPRVRVYTNIILWQCNRRNAQ